MLCLILKTNEKQEEEEENKPCLIQGKSFFSYFTWGIPFKAKSSGYLIVTKLI